MDESEAATSSGEVRSRPICGWKAAKSVISVVDSEERGGCDGKEGYLIQQ